MTVQIKRFIELADIIGLRLECKVCGSSLSLGNSEKDALVDKVLNTAATLSRCPTCGHEWTKDTHYTHGDSDIKSFFRTLRELRTLEKTFGCTLKLEISGDEKP